MTFPRYMILAVGGLALLVAGLAVAAPAVVSTGLVKQRIAESIAGWTGGTVTVGEEPTIGVFPVFGVEVRDVRVSRADGSNRSSIAIPSIRATPDPWALLTGRIDVGTVEMVGPQVRIIVDESDDAAFGEGLKRAVISAVLLGERTPRPEEIVVREGSVVYENRRTGRATSATEVDLHLARQNAKNASMVSGSFLWQGTRIAIDAGLHEPEAALSGSERRGRLTVAARPQGETGEVSDGQGLVDELTSAGLWPHRLAGRLNIPLAPNPWHGPLTVEGGIAVRDDVATLSDATFDLLGTTAKGDFSLDFAGDRPALRGTLRAEYLDLVPYIRQLVPPSMAALLATPLSAGWIPDADVDVELAADTVDVGRVRVTGLETLVATREDRMTVELRDARMGDGYAKGKLDLLQVAGGLAMRLSGTLGDAGGVDAGKLLWNARASRLIETTGPPEGRGEAGFDLSGDGGSVGSLLLSLSGSLAVDLRDGSIGGADLVDSLERLEEDGTVLNEGKTPFLPTPGRTEFDRLTARVELRDGVVRARRVRIAAPQLDVVFGGTGRLRTGEIDVEGTASLLKGDGERSGARTVVQLPFGIGGTVRQPIVAPGILRIEETP